jgi:hypothetical protein
MRIRVQHNTQEKTNVEENNKQNKERNTISQRKARVSNTQAEPVGGKGPPTRGEIASVETDQSARTRATPQRGESQDTHRRTWRKAITTRKKPRSRSN